MDALLQDLRYAFRTLRRSPGFAVVAALTLALGIGVNATVFSAVNAILLRPLPYADPGRLVALQMHGPGGGSIDKETLVELRARARSLAGLAGYSGWGFTLTGRGEPEALSGAMATADLFQVLGARPLLGTTFRPEDGLPGAAPVAVLSHALWRRRFGGDPSVVGRAVTLNGRPATVLGVMPPAFQFPARTAEVWVATPVDPAARDDYTAGYLLTVGRLRAGATVQEASAEARALAAGLHRERPERYGERFGAQAGAASFREVVSGKVRPVLLLLLGAVGCVLLIACANVANLMLARAAGRGRELAVRAALGAGRGRVTRQLLTESGVLALLGGGAGLLLAHWGASLLGGALPRELVRGDRVGVDGAVLGFTLAVSLLAGLVFGLAPALRAGRADLAGTLREREAGPGAGRGRLRSGLVVAEVALALLLTAGAGLMLRSFWHLQSQDAGFRTAGVLAAKVSPPGAEYGDAARRLAFWSETLDRLAALPGVEAAGAVHLMPLGGSNWNPPLNVEGREPLAEVDWRVASWDYFRTLGVPVVRGRGFTPADREGSPPVAMVNATLANTVFPGQNPLGRRVWTAFEGEGKWVTIVGVVGDTKDQTLAAPARPQLYRPLAQHPLTSMAVMVRTDGDPSRLADAVRRAVWAVDPDVPVSDVQPLGRVVAGSIRQPRALAALLGAFGVLSLVLGAVGIYGVISYTVGQRTREFGVRLALGARARDLAALVLGQSLRLAGLGLAIGVVAAAALTRVLAAQLYGVRPTDPVAFAGAAAVLAGVALLASWLPARRAARVDPMTALRAE